MSSRHREESTRLICLIPRVVKQGQFYGHYPLFGGRRIYVSFVWTIHGGSCCYCSYPASRSLCCLSLGPNCCLSAHLVPSPPRSFEWEIEVEVRQSLASFLLSTAAFGCWNEARLSFKNSGRRGFANGGVREADFSAALLTRMP